MQALTTIYSQPSVEEAKNLINCFINTFGVGGVTADEMFYYNVFCSADTYAVYDWARIHVLASFDIPSIFVSACSTTEEKLDYVIRTINEVIKGEIDKPEWMSFIEMETSQDCYDNPPSNFLYLLSKEDKYKELGEKLVNFLYSPNRIKVVR